MGEGGIQNSQKIPTSFMDSPEHDGMCVETEKADYYTAVLLECVIKSNSKKLQIKGTGKLNI